MFKGRTIPLGKSDFQLWEIEPSGHEAAGCQKKILLNLTFLITIFFCKFIQTTACFLLNKMIVQLFCTYLATDKHHPKQNIIFPYYLAKDECNFRFPSHFVMPTIYYLKYMYHRDIDANEKENNSVTNSNGYTGMKNNDIYHCSSCMTFNISG